MFGITDEIIEERDNVIKKLFAARELICDLQKENEELKAQIFEMRMSSPAMEE